VVGRKEEKEEGFPWGGLGGLLNFKKLIFYI
jgi:hypothetical protein